MSQANPIVSGVMERVCAEVLMPQTDAGTLTWQWTSDGALETTRDGVRIVLALIRSRAIASLSSETEPTT